MDLTQFFVEDEARTGIAKIFEANARIAPNLPIEKMEGLVHKSGKEVGLGEIKRRTVNMAPPATAPSRVVPVEERICIGTSKVTTDYRIESAKTGSRAVEIARRSRNLARWWDNEILHGDAATDPEQLSGFKNRCAGNQLLWAGANGAALNAVPLGP